jgi:hypothetical protein
VDSIDHKETRPTRYHVLFPQKAKGVSSGRDETDIHSYRKHHASKEKQIDMGVEDVFENGGQNQPTRKKLI